MIFNNRQYKTKRFKTVADANKFLVKNPEWGVLTEKTTFAGKHIYCAKNDDKGIPQKKR